MRTADSTGRRPPQRDRHALVISSVSPASQPHSSSSQSWPSSSPSFAMGVFDRPHRLATGASRRSSSVREWGERPVPVHEDNRLAHPTRLVPAHPWRVGGHALQRKAGGSRAISQQPTDRLDRHVPFDRVAGEDRGMARRRLVGHTDRPAELRPRRIIGHVDRRTVRSQVPDPRGAAASTRVSMDGERQPGQ